MDTRADFFTKELLNILFFQQMNLIVFPYVDIKHLSALKTFAIGYNIIEIDATSVYDIENMLKFSIIDSYNEFPPLYIIYNLDRKRIKNISLLKDIRCIINTHDNLAKFNVNNNFAIYNKKRKSFLNFDFKDYNLEFEKEIISNSEDEIELYDNIQKIMTVANKIFREVSRKGGNAEIKGFLSKYDNRFRKKILNFVEKYHKIQIPNNIQYFKNLKKNNSSIYKHPESPQIDLIKKFDEEYDLIATLNLNIADEFFKLLLDYRMEHVNNSNLELEQLCNPKKLYEYLRQNHWKNGISKDFLQDWIKMKLSNYNLKEDDIFDFKKIFSIINFSDLEILSSNFRDESNNNFKYKDFEISINSNNDEIPSIQDFDNFSKWFVKLIDDLEKFLK